MRDGLCVVCTMQCHFYERMREERWMHGMAQKIKENNFIYFDAYFARKKTTDNCLNLVCATQSWIVIMNVRATWERTLHCITEEKSFECDVSHWSTDSIYRRLAMKILISPWSQSGRMASIVSTHSILIFSILVFVEWTFQIIFLFYSCHCLLQRTSDQRDRMTLCSRFNFHADLWTNDTLR